MTIGFAGYRQQKLVVNPMHVMVIPLMSCVSDRYLTDLRPSWQAAGQTSIVTTRSCPLMEIAAIKTSKPGCLQELYLFFRVGYACVAGLSTCGF